MRQRTRRAPANPFRHEPGWTGAFTRGNAPGALVAGTPVEKTRSEPGDGNPDGTRGTVLGSFSHPDVRDGEVIYFVEWASAPRVAVGIMAWKVKAAS